MKIITMGTLKGGAGKTINLFNIASIIAETSKVLLIDVDPQCNLSFDCGVDITKRNVLTVRDIFSNTYKAQPSAEQIIIKSPVQELPNLDIIPSSILLFKTERKIQSVSNREHILENYIKDNIDTFEQYDYIFIDTNPSMSITNLNAFYIADEIILSSDVSTNSINGAELFCELWDEYREELRKEDNIAAIIISNYDKRTKLGKELITYTKQANFSKELVLDAIIPSTVKLKDCEVRHKPVNILHPDTDICKAFREVVKELKDREVL